LHEADGEDQAPQPDQYEQVSVPKSEHFFEPIESPLQSMPAIPFRHRLTRVWTPLPHSPVQAFHAPHGSHLAIMDPLPPWPWTFFEAFL